MLELKKISKIYKVAGSNQVALDKVSIKFRKSEFVSILGQSGSGKTTLLNIVGGLDDYTSGDLIINGKSTKKYTDRDWDTYRNHSIGFVFQSYNLIPHQTALQNVELSLTLSGISKKERIKKSKEVLKKVGLESQMYKRPNQMSGGQMQRIAIARALVNDPDILLADEPTGALDSETSIQIMELLKEIAEDRLVIMVTHNPDIAYDYSTRIIKLLDGEVIDDSDPYLDENEEQTKKATKKSKKTYMNFRTALGLSLNNLLTKKGRTILTAFAGSIGIIGIALILSLSHGINKYIERTEEETLSSYPLVIEKENVDMSSLLKAFAGSYDGKKYKDNKVHSINIMGDLFETMSQKVKHNDIKALKEYLETKSNIKDYTSDIEYTYNVTMNLYKTDPNKIVRVNPTTVLDVIGFGASGVSSLYSGYMANYDVFYELLNNKELNERQYEIVEGRWPKEYNEVVLEVDEYNRISDYTMYSLGLLNQDDLKEDFNKMTSGEKVTTKDYSFTIDEVMNLSFKLVLNTDYYVKENGIWVDKSNDEKHMRSILDNAEEIKIVGILKKKKDAIGGNGGYGMVGYKHELMEHLINKINETEIVKEQLANKDINVFTGSAFSTNSTFDISSLTKEQMAAFQNMSETELAEFMQSYSQNMTSSYDENVRKLGIAEIDNPDGISLYPKDFDSKEEIERIIEDYNKGKKEADQIEYTDIVGVMMSSVQSIVNVISSVLIAFVAISLVVSSIMIAIITYISVIERIKEIGILRAVGASKKDISRVFNAETFIEGTIAGIMGILVTLLLNIPINIIIKNKLNISNISILPVKGAIILIIISMVLTLIAGFIPAKIASKKDPVEALRTE